jgi:hypothetical protein
MRRCIAFVLVAVLAGALAGAADAGTVGVTGTIKGAGAMQSVEGGPYFCSLTNDYNQSAQSNCDRLAFEAPLESWVWLKAVPSNVPSGNWSFAGWQGCDQTRGVGTATECAVHSGAFTLDERNPVAIFVDVQSPDISLGANPSGTVINATQSISFFSSDPTASFRCRIDTAAASPCSPGTFTFTEGPHTFRVQSVDPSGRASAEATRTFTVDTIPPIVTITGGPSAGSTTASATANFTFTAGEPSQFLCSLDGSVFAACGGPNVTGSGISYPGLANGPHTFQVRANDTRLTGPTVSRSWTVDTVPPAAPTITSGPDRPTASTSASFAFTGPADAASFRCSLDGGAQTTCTSPVSYPSVTPGPHTVAVTALDAVGNESTAATRAWSVDMTAPASPALTITGSTATTLSVSWPASTDPNGPVSYDLFMDATKVASLTSTAFTFTGRVCGVGQTIGIEAVDGLGNRSPRTTLMLASTACPPAPDIVKPNTTLLRGPAARTKARLATFRFSSNEVGSTFQCKLDRGRWTACKSPKTYRNLKKGLHTFQVRAKDRAGNLDRTPAKKTWRIR